jgi:hypothetical protein
MSQTAFADNFCTADRISEIQDVCFEATNDAEEMRCLKRELKKQCGIDCEIDFTNKHKIKCDKGMEI